jgi:peptidoglycan hydrolase CwlO-like protein
MPAPLKIAIKNTIYTTPILDEEMEMLSQQIQDKKEEISSLKKHLNNAVTDLENLQNQFMALYIKQTGQFPSNE